MNEVYTKGIDSGAWNKGGKMMNGELRTASTLFNFRDANPPKQHYMNSQRKNTYKFIVFCVCFTSISLVHFLSVCINGRSIRRTESVAWMGPGAVIRWNIAFQSICRAAGGCGLRQPVPKGRGEAYGGWVSRRAVPPVRSPKRVTPVETARRYVVFEGSTCAHVWFRSARGGLRFFRCRRLLFSRLFSCAFFCVNRKEAL